MSTSPQNLLKTSKIIFLITILLAGVSAAQAITTWKGATQAPPGDNPSEPLNVGPNAQYKEGSLKLDGTTNPQAKASLELGGSNTGGATKGFLPPRVNRAERDANIGCNASLKGLTVYNIQDNRLELCDGSGPAGWIAASAGGGVGEGSGSPIDGPAFMAGLRLPNSNGLSPRSGTTNGSFNSIRTGISTNPASPTKLAFSDTFTAGAGDLASPFFDTNVLSSAQGDFSGTANEFIPMVPGQYILTATAEGNFGRGASLSIYRSNGAIEVVRATANTASLTTLTATAVVRVTQNDIDFGRNRFDVRASIASGDYIWMAPQATHFSGSRVGAPVTVIQQVYSVIPPQNGVIMATGPNCPPADTARGDTTGYTLLGPVGDYTISSAGATVQLVLCKKN